MSLPLPVDLAAYLQREAFTGSEDASAQLALDIAYGIVVARTGQTFVRVDNDQIILDAHGEDVRLPQRPVIDVTSVTTRNRGATVTTTRTLNTDYEHRSDRLRWVGVGWWPYEVAVTYSHGYDEIPADVSGAILAVAVELMVNPEGLASSAIDDSTDKHEWSDDSPAEKMLKLVERRYSRKPLTVRLR